MIHTWTEMEVWRKQGSLVIPASWPCRDIGSRLDGYDRFTADKDISLHYAAVKPFPHKEAYVRLIASLNARMVILLSDDERAVSEMTHALRNCLVLGRDGELDEAVKGHVYFLPLHLHMLATAWASGNGRRIGRIRDLPEDGVEAWVNGIRYPFAQACKQCHRVIDKTLGMCRPMHISCGGMRSFPFSALFKPEFKPDPEIIERIADEPCGAEERQRIHQARADERRRAYEAAEEYMESARRWYDEHGMRIDSLDRHLPDKLYKYRPATEICVRDPFEQVSLSGLTDDEASLEKQARIRSERARTAAVTRRYDKYICEGCIHREHGYDYCHKRGGANCGTGPFYQDDYQYLADECEPWELWGLEITNHRVDARSCAELDVRIAGKIWEKARTTSYSIAGPTRRGAFRGIRMVKLLARSADHMSTSIEDAARVVGEALGRAVDVCWSWDNVRRCCPTLVELYGWPLPDWVKAAARVLATEKYLSKTTSNWSQTSYPLSGVSLNRGSIMLRFDMSDGYTAETVYISSLWDLRNLSSSISLEQTRRRAMESRLLKELVLEHKVPLPGTCFREIASRHPEWVDEPPEPKTWKRVINKARKAAGQGKDRAGNVLEKLKEMDF